jgi:dTDP-4-amino-4,6-dideoxygalactose transaminase
MLSVKLKHLNLEIKRRREVANAYSKGIKNPLITLPILDQTFDVTNFEQHVWHVFVIRCEQREALQKYLLERGVSTLIHYPIPPHKQGAYKELEESSFPVSELIHKQMLSLPIGPTITDEEVALVIAACNGFQAEMK